MREFWGTAIGVCIFLYFYSSSRRARLEALLNFENVAMMGQAIEQCRRHLGAAEDIRPFGEGEVGRQNDRGALVHPADQVE